jgi:hypothetical protein
MDSTALHEDLSYCIPYPGGFRQVLHLPFDFCYGVESEFYWPDYA